MSATVSVLFAFISIDSGCLRPAIWGNCCTHRIKCVCNIRVHPPCMANATPTICVENETCRWTDSHTGSLHHDITSPLCSGMLPTTMRHFLTYPLLHSVMCRLGSWHANVFCHLSRHLVSSHILFHHVSPSQLWSASISLPITLICNIILVASSLYRLCDVKTI